MTLLDLLQKKETKGQHYKGITYVDTRSDGGRLRWLERIAKDLRHLAELHQLDLQAHLLQWGAEHFGQLAGGERGVTLARVEPVTRALSHTTCSTSALCGTVA